MSEQHVHPNQIITKAITLATTRGHEPGFTSSSTGPVVRRAEKDRFTVEFAAITGSGIKATSIKIFLDGEKVFWAVFEHGWEEDSDTKLLHWGPRHDWRSDFMALPD